MDLMSEFQSLQTRSSAHAILAAITAKTMTVCVLLAVTFTFQGSLACSRTLVGNSLQTLRPFSPWGKFGKLNKRHTHCENQKKKIAHT